MAKNSFIPLSFINLSFTKLTFIPLASLLIVTTFLISCGGSQVLRSDTVETSAALLVDVKKATKDLDGTLAEMKNLRDVSDNADLKKIQSDLKTKSSLLSDSLSEVIFSSKEAVTAGKIQNDAWHKKAETFSDTNLRKASLERQSDLRVSIEELAVASAALKSEHDTFISKLNQVVSALNLDLTMQGVEVIKPTLATLIDKEPTLRESLSNVAAKGKAVNTLINP